MQFSIVMTLFETPHFLPRAISTLLQQTNSDWELILVSDGPFPDSPYHPEKLKKNLLTFHPELRWRNFETAAAPGCFGNRARHFGLQQANGNYICWVNHDNLILPNYLEAQQENITRTPDCLSLVDIELWQNHLYRGRFPKALRRSRIDLLNIALPRKTALEIDAFGKQVERIYAADWNLFAEASKHLKIEWNHQVAGTHF